MAPKKEKKTQEKEPAPVISGAGDPQVDDSGTAKAMVPGSSREGESSPKLNAKPSAESEVKDGGDDNQSRKPSDSKPSATSSTPAASELILGKGAPLPPEHDNVDGHRELVGEVVKKTVAMAPIITLNDLVDMMSISLHTNRPLKIDLSIDVKLLSAAKLELPKELTRPTPHIFFTYNETHDWVVIQQKVEHARTPFSDYHGWLKRWRHTLEKLTKDAYTVYRIDERVDMMVDRIVPFDYAGFDSSIMKVQNGVFNDDLKALAKLCIPRSMPNVDYDFVKIAIPKPMLRTVEALQAFVCSPTLDIVAWIEKFTLKKVLRSDHKVSLIPPDPNCKYIRHPHPQLLPRFLAILPRWNVISLCYSMPFVCPEVQLNDVDVTTISRNMSLNTNKSDGVGLFLSMSPTDKNFKDFQKILLAMIMPNQVMINVTRDEEVADTIKGLCALSAKMLFSRTEGYTNITSDAADYIDDMIVEFLYSSGVVLTDRTDPRSVNFDQRYNKSAALWKQVIGLTDRGGWINEGFTGYTQIKDPLYPDITQLPQYAGISSYGTRDAFNLEKAIAYPPVLSNIVKAIVSLKATKSSALDQIKTILDSLATPWMTSISMLNDFILRTGETGFRMSTLKSLSILDPRADNPCGAIREAPIVLDINLSSVMLFLRQMPAKYLSSPHLPQQPVIESAISAELQRLYSLILLTRERIAVDGRADLIKKGSLLSIILSSTESNHFARQMLEIAFSSDGSQSFSLDDVSEVSSLFDDFEAMNYKVASQDVLRHPEFFGMTQNVVRKLRETPIITEAKYREKRLTGILCQNDTDVPPDKITAMSFDTMNLHLSNRSLMSQLVGHPGRYTLPIWIEYEERLVSQWPAEAEAYRIELNDAREGNLSAELVHYDKFSRVYVVPDHWQTFSEDSYLLGVTARKYWYSGRAGYTETYNKLKLLEKLTSDVRSWRKYVVFHSVFDIIGNPATK